MKNALIAQIPDCIAHRGEEWSQVFKVALPALLDLRLLIELILKPLNMVFVCLAVPDPLGNCLGDVPKLPNDLGYGIVVLPVSIAGPTQTLL